MLNIIAKLTPQWDTAETRNLQLKTRAIRLVRAFRGSYPQSGKAPRHPHPQLFAVNVSFCGEMKNTLGNKFFGVIGMFTFDPKGQSPQLPISRDSH